MNWFTLDDRTQSFNLDHAIQVDWESDGTSRVYLRVHPNSDVLDEFTLTANETVRLRANLGIGSFPPAPGTEQPWARTHAREEAHRQPPSAGTVVSVILGSMLAVGLALYALKVIW